MIRRNLQRANKKNTGSVFFLTATLLLIPWTEPARAHIADGENVLTDWHWRWDVIFVLGIFARTHVNVERFRLRISPRDQDKLP